MKSDLLRAILVFLAFFVVIGLAGRAIAQGLFSSTSTYSSETVALIKVEGAITGASTADGLFAMETGASSMTITDQLYAARDDDSIVAVVLRVNSPGGSAAASDEIYQAIKACREVKPVVVSMGDVAASGGYYIAAAADYIFANGATLTGSIGVIFSLMNWEDLADKVGIDDITLTAGKHKDIGSPWRDMTAGEKKILKELLDDVHDQFITAVAEGREGLDEEQVREVATGMIFTGSKALELGLIDELGGLHAAGDKARELASVGPGVPIEEYGQPASIWDEIFAFNSAVPPVAAVASQFTADPLVMLSRGMYMSSFLENLSVR